MLFNSSLLGEVDVDENTIITFAHGLAAFENCTRFKLFHDADRNNPRVYWLQSLDNPDVLFSVTDPGRLGIRYEVLLSDDEIASLALARPRRHGAADCLPRGGQQRNQPAAGAAARQCTQPADH